MTAEVPANVASPLVARFTATELASMIEMKEALRDAATQRLTAAQSEIGALTAEIDQLKKMHGAMPTSGTVTFQLIRE
jgi:hypothetical protein